MLPLQAGGVLLLRTWAPHAALAGLGAQALYCIDSFLPIVELNWFHKYLDIPNGWHWYFHFLQVSGYGLAALIVARLSGAVK